MKRKGRRIGFAVAGLVFLSAGLLFSYLAFVRAPAWPQDAIHVPRDVSTLQEALDRVESGGTIVLSEGAFPLSAAVRIEVPGITLAATGSGARLILEEEAPALSILADGVIVRNLEVVADGVGILLEASGCRFERMVVQGASTGIQLVGARGNELTGISIEDSQVGFELITSDGNVVSDLSILSANETGIRILGSWENRFERGRITGAGMGVTLEEGATENTLSEIDVEGADEVAIHVVGSNDTTIQRSAIQSSNLGIAVERATGTVIRDCRIENPETIGISLLQALQNRIEQTTIHGFGEAGIRLSQSGENALLSNRIFEAAGTGILLEDSSKSLLQDNDVRKVPVGLWLHGATAVRLLRNTVAECSDAGIILENGAENRLLDNALNGNWIGLLIEGGADHTVLRNQMSAHTGGAILIGHTASGIRVLDNEMRANEIGVLISGAGRAEVFGNSFVANTAGLHLISPAAGLRIEANRFEGNGVGLDLSPEPAELLSSVEDRLGFRVWNPDARYAAPVLTNNTFARNTSLDIRTTAGLPLYAAGNWWGADAVRDAASARVSGGVDLQESAWVGTVTLGTESDTAQILLGRLLQFMLEDAGYRVIDLIGMGNGPRMQRALRSGDVDVVWWTGPEEEPASWVIETIPAPEGWIAVVGESLASELPDPSIGALVERSTVTGERWVLAVPSAFGEDAMAQLVSTYEMDAAIEAISWTQTLEEAETLLKFGAADLALVGSLEETVTRSGFVQLADRLDALAFGEIAAVLRMQLIAESPEIREIVRRLGTRLTADALHDLMGRVRLMHRTPMDVAAEFLVQEGLLAE